MNTVTATMLKDVDHTLFDVDSYIISHHKIYPANMERGLLYGGARGDSSETVVFMGLQYVLNQLVVPTIDVVEMMRVLCQQHFGRDDVFHYEGWKYIAELGYFPLHIRAVAEGSTVPKGCPLFTVENTDDTGKLGWLPGWFETQFVRTWFPTNVATLCRDLKAVILPSLEKTGTPEEIDFKLHDFGSRGATCREQARLGSIAHQVFFKGTDTFIGIPAAMMYYGAALADIPNSIPASGHAPITSWGRQWEKDAYRNMIHQYGGPGQMYACVSDSYDLGEALKMWKSLESDILEVGGRLVVRPDSGDPVTTPVWVIEELMRLFGHDVNDKGYKVLPPHIRVLQGDGIDLLSVKAILIELETKGISADNIAFGMGGALMQQHDRGSHDFAMKMCWCSVEGEGRDVYKDPVTDSKKTSIRGRVMTVLDTATGEMVTRREEEIEAELQRSLMKTAYINGSIKTDTLAAISQRANQR